MPAAAGDPRRDGPAAREHRAPGVDARCTAGGGRARQVAGSGPGEPGDIVLAVLNNEFTLKRLYRKGGVIKLVPENQRYPTIVVKPEEEFSVWGVVTYNLHKLY